MQTNWDDEFSNWVTAAKAAKILDRDPATVSRYGILGVIPLRVRGASKYFYLPSVLELVPPERGTSSAASDLRKATLRRTEESIAKRFHDRVEASWKDVIYQTHPVEDGVEIVAFCKEGKQWVPVEKEVVSRKPKSDGKKGRVGRAKEVGK